ncbi:hypothetical protein GCM10020220_008160 [Nonomuraea rubra]
MGLAQLLAGLDAEIVDELAPDGGVGVQRLGPPAATVQGQDELLPEILPVRMLADQLPQVVDGGGVLAGRQLRRDQFLGRAQPGLGERPQPRVPGRAGGQVAEGFAAPQRERLAQVRGGLPGTPARPRPGHQVLEQQQVQPVRLHLDRVTRGVGGDAGSRRAEDPA